MAGGPVYSTTLTASFTPTGNYTVQIFANDTVGNNDTSQASWYAAYLNLTDSHAITVDGALTDWSGVINITDALDVGGGTPGFAENANVWNYSVDFGAWNDWATKVRSDRNNNLLVAGYSTSGTQNCQVVKLNQSGWNILNYSANFGGTCTFYALAVDSQNGFAAAGWNQSTGRNYSVIMRFNSSGVNVWNYSADLGGTSIWKGLAYDSSNNLLVVGANATYLWVMKFNSSNVNVWNYTQNLGGAITLGAPGMEVATDSQDNFIVVGYNSSWNWLIMKFNSSNAQVWNYSFVTNDFVTGVAVDSYDSFIVVGANSTGANDLWRIMKFNRSNVNVWNLTVALGGTSYKATGVATDALDNFIVSGFNGSSAADQYWWAMKFNASNVNTWNYSDKAGEHGRGLNVGTDYLNNFYVAGYWNMTAGGSDWRIMKFAGPATNPTYDITQVSLDNNGANLYAYLKMNGTAPPAGGNYPVNVYLSTDPTKGNSSAISGQPLPFPYNYRLEVKDGVCRTYNYTGANVSACTYSSTGSVIEISEAAADLGLTTGSRINATFETSSGDYRFDAAPDFRSFLEYNMTLVSGTVPVTVCGNLNAPNTYYMLQNDIRGVVGSCINITADNVTFDGGGHVIDGDAAGTDSGILANGTRFNVSVVNTWVQEFYYNIWYQSANYSTIFNCTSNSSTWNGVLVNKSYSLSVINNTVRNTPNDRGINMVGVNKSTITGNYIANSSFSGIYCEQCYNNTLSNNTLNSIGSAGIFLWYPAVNNIISGNTLINTSITGTSAGIYLFCSENNTIGDNNMYRVYFGVSLSCSKGNVIYNNTFNTTGVSGSGGGGYGITNYSTNNAISGGSIFNSSVYGFGFLTAPSTNNNFTNVYINTSTVYWSIAAGVNINGTYLIDQPLTNYTIYSPGSMINFKDSVDGEIDFLKPIMGRGPNISAEIIISPNSVWVNYSNLNLTKAANITLYNLPAFTNPVMMMNGTTVCNSTTTPKCINFTALTGSTVSFNVTNWTGNFSIGEASRALVGVYTTYPQGNVNVTRNAWFNVTLNVTCLSGTCGTVNVTLDPVGLTDIQANVTLNQTLGSFFGWHVASGDFNGDGYSDALIDAFFVGSGNDSVYVFYGKPNWVGGANDTRANVTINGTFNSGTTGWSVASGNFNGDQYSDVAIGEHPNFGYNGQVYIFYGKAGWNGSYRDTQSNVTLNGTFTGHFGSSMASGDFNGDGYDDLLVGALGGSNGAAYIFYGSPSWRGSYRDTQANVTINGTLAGSFGTSTASGDFNHDNYDDAIIGDPYVGGGSNGAAYIFYGGPSWNGTYRDYQANVTINGTLARIFGVSAASGDFNGDNFDDALIGGYVTNGNGSAYIFYGGPSWNGTYRDYQANVTVNSTLSEEMGVGVASGDFNGDGFADALIGADDPNAYGSAYIFYGGPVWNRTYRDVQANVTINSTIQWATFGSTVASGDFNGNGASDALIGAPNNLGGSYIFYLGNPPVKGIIPVGSGTPFYTNASANPQTTASLSAGQSQIIVFWVNATGAAGTTYVFYADANLTSQPSTGNTTARWNVTIQNATSATQLTACGVLNVTGMTYLLQNDVNSTGTCFNITANNVTLDGAGHLVNYSTSGSGSSVGYGVYIDGVNYSMAKNLTIVEGPNSGTSNHAIYMDTIFYTQIKDNRITTYNSWSSGIYQYYSDNNTIANNTINASNDFLAGIYMYASDNNIVSGNRINISGDTMFGTEGIMASTSDANTFAGNQITTIIGPGFLISTSTRQNLTGNSVNSSWNSGYVLAGDSPAHFNHTIGTTNLAEGKPVNYTWNVRDRVYSGVDYTPYGEVIFGSASNLTIRNCNFTYDSLNLFNVSGSTVAGNRFNATAGFGINLYYNTFDINVANNTIFAIGGAGVNVEEDVWKVNITGNNITGRDAEGIDLDTWVNYTIISNNRISTTDDEGIYLKQAWDNIISNNTINITGISSGSSTGIYLDADDLNHGNNFMDNVITVSADSAFGIYIAWGPNNNTFLRNNVTVAGNVPTGIYIGQESSDNTFAQTIVQSIGDQADGLVIPYQGANFSIIDSILNLSYAYTAESDVWVTPSATTGLWNFTNVTGHKGLPLNVTYDPNPGGTLNYMWWLDVYANYTNGSVASGVRVNVTDRFGTLIYSGQTGSDGRITRQPLREYNQTGPAAKTYYSNYTVNASLGASTLSNQTNMSTNRLLVFTFASAPSNVLSACSILPLANTRYTMASSIVNNSLTSACMNVTAENVTLDCLGYNISSSNSVPGVYSNQKYTNVTNCLIDVGTGASGSGIMLERANGSVVYNNTLIASRRGVYLSSTDRATVRDNFIENQTGPYAGIEMQSSSHNTIMNNIVRRATASNIYVQAGTNNTLLNNTVAYATLHGIETYQTNGNRFINNTAYNNTQMGIYLDSSSYNNLTGNNMSRNWANFHIYGTTLAHFNNSIDPSNLVERGLKIYYNYSIRNYNYTPATAPSAGAVFCINCVNISVRDMDVSGTNYYGIYLFATNTSLVTNVTAQNCTGAGIWLDWAYNNTIRNVTLSNDVIGLVFGMTGGQSANNIITDSTIKTNTYGLYFNSQNNTGENLTLKDNTDDSIDFEQANNTRLKNIFLNASSDTGANGAIIFINSSHVLIQDANLTTTSASLISVSQYSINDTFLNCSYNSSEEASSGELIRKWYYRAYVNDTAGNPVDTATVGIYNNTGTQQTSLTTAATGLTPIYEITDYINKGTPNYQSNYTINATKAGIGTAQHPYNATQQKNTLLDVFTLQSGPAVSFVAPTRPNGTVTSNATEPVNASIVTSSLRSVIYRFDGANTSYYDDSLVLMYNLDNVTALGENNTWAADASRYGYNGTINGSTWTTAGKFGKALKFDGVNDYVDAGDVGAVDGRNRITVSAWVKANVVGEASSEIHFVDKSQCLGQTDGGVFELHAGSTAPNKAEFVVFSSGGAGQAFYTSGAGVTSVDDTKWHLVTGVYDGSDISIYVDGSREAHNTVSGLTFSSTADHLQVGGDCNGQGQTNGYLWNGTLDEVRVWNRSLSASEIAQMYSVNLYRYDTDKWALSGNLSSAYGILTNGNHTYQVFVNDSSASAQTEERLLTVNRTTYVTGCRVLNETGMTYLLQNNVNSTGTCFNITADYVTLDGQGHLVNYSTSGSGSDVGYGVYTELTHYLAVRNLTLLEGPNDGYNNHAVVLEEATNSVITANRIDTSTSQTSGIYLWGASFNTVANNTVTVNGGDYLAGIFLYTGSDYNAFSGNIINVSGANAYDSHGFTLYSVVGNAFTGNQITAAAGAGFYLSTSYLTNLTGNRVNTSAQSGYLIHGDTLAHFNHTIDSSNLAEGRPVNYTWDVHDRVYSGVDYTPYGEVIFGSASNITIRNSNFSWDGLNLFNVSGSTVAANRLNSTTGYSVNLEYDTYDINVANNTVYATGGAGINLKEYASRVNVTGNNITVTDADGINLNYYIDSALVTNNRIKGTDSTGLYFWASWDNVVSNNTFNITGTYMGSTNGIIVNDILTGGNNLTDNTVLLSADTAYGVSIGPGAHDNTFLRNNITVIGNTAIGIRVYYDTAGNKFAQTVVNAMGDYSNGILISNQNASFAMTDSILNLSYAYVDESDVWIAPAAIDGIWNFTNVTGHNGLPLNVSWDAGAAGNLTNMWWLDVYVNYTNGSVASGAQVNVTDRYQRLKYTGLTDASGRLRTSLIEYVRNDTDGTTMTYFSNYSVNATAGTVTLNNQTNMSANRFMSFTFASSTCIPTPGKDWVIDAAENCYILGKDYSVGNITFINTGTLTIENTNITCDGRQIKNGVSVRSKPPFRWAIK
jgi:parallel beta-helix repeat protein